VSGYQLTLQGLETPVGVAADSFVPVVFTMAEMGIDFPLVLLDTPINRYFQVPNPNYEMPESGMPGRSGYPGTMGGPMGGGMGMGMGAGLQIPSTTGGAGATRPPGTSGLTPPSGSRGGAPGAKSDKDEDTDAGPQEEPFLTVPRYDFIVQFVWKETLLTQRLEKQISDWEKEKQKQGAQPPPAGDNLAANTKGGA
jgi:hypothetical protein